MIRIPAMAWARAIHVSNQYFVRSTTLQILTSTRVLVEEAGLVTTEETSGLDLRSRTTGQTGVEVHHALHAGGILGGTDSLDKFREGSGAGGVPGALAHTTQEFGLLTLGEAI